MKNPVTEAREALGISQAELARRAGVHYVTINRIERGHSAGADEVWSDLADALGTSPARLRHGDDLAPVMEAITSFKRLPSDPERLHGLARAVNELVTDRGVSPASRLR